MNAHSTQLSACHKHYKNLQPRTKKIVYKCVNKQNYFGHSIQQTLL